MSRTIGNFIHVVNDIENAACMMQTDGLGATISSFDDDIRRTL